MSRGAEDSREGWCSGLRGGLLSENLLGKGLCRRNEVKDLEMERASQTAWVALNPMTSALGRDMHRGGGDVETGSDADTSPGSWQQQELGEAAWIPRAPGSGAPLTPGLWASGLQTGENPPLLF